MMQMSLMLRDRSSDLRPVYKSEPPRRSSVKSADQTLKLFDSLEYDFSVLVEAPGPNGPIFVEPAPEPMPTVTFQIRLRQKDPLVQVPCRVADVQRLEGNRFRVRGAWLEAPGGAWLEGGLLERGPLGGAALGPTCNGQRTVLFVTVTYHSSRGMGCITAGAQIKLYERGSPRATAGDDLGMVVMRGEAAPCPSPDAVAEAMVQGNFQPETTVMHPFLSVFATPARVPPATTRVARLREWPRRAGRGGRATTTAQLESEEPPVSTPIRVP